MQRFSYLLLVVFLVETTVSLPSPKEKIHSSSSMKRQSDTCASNELPCGDGTCYYSGYQCDAWPDCADISDDLGCGDCAADEYMCLSGECIPSYWVCDRWPDCSDLTDERGCELVNPCTDTEYECNNGQCIPGAFQCDSWIDCSWGEDDIGCSPCSENEFLCSNGNCVPHGDLCNSWNNCGDNSDENGCYIITGQDATKRSKSSKEDKEMYQQQALKRKLKIQASKTKRTNELKKPKPAGRMSNQEKFLRKIKKPQQFLRKIGKPEK